MTVSVDKKLFSTLKASQLAYASKRREVIKQSGDAQHHAKRAIFALQRGDAVEACERLDSARKIFIALEKQYQKDPGLFAEGSYQAGLEEFVEADVFRQFVETKKIGMVKGIKVSNDVYIAGLCDVPGELQRYAIKAATARDFALVQDCAAAATQILHELVEFNLTSYLRTKFDQAKQAMHRLEQVVYETSLQK
ncbi:MAG: hypothetical protein KAZ30_02735 [Candidatus Magasanikbacteria bacterium]|nr:hypothetical protein [Candidatus Magasanikbacteria bacterium]